jgi:hypothetical protein
VQIVRLTRTSSLLHPGEMETKFNFGLSDMILVWRLSLYLTKVQIHRTCMCQQPDRILNICLFSNIRSYPFLTDFNLILHSLSGNQPLLFPGLDVNIKAHAGFALEQAITANDVLAAVLKTISLYNATTVTLTGHSLGASLSLLNAIFLQLYLPPAVAVKVIVYSLVKVGNQEFADYVDSNLDVTRIANRNDIISEMPPFPPYQQISGEISIQEMGDWVACPGQDNLDSRCGVHPFFDASLAQHLGPFDGIVVGCDHGLPIISVA